MGIRRISIAKMLSAMFFSSIISTAFIWWYFLSDFPYSYGLSEKENEARIESLYIAWVDGEFSETLQVPVLGHVFLVDVMNDERTVVEGFSQNVLLLRNMQIDTGDCLVQLWEKEGGGGVIF